MAGSTVSWEDVWRRRYEPFWPNGQPRAAPENPGTGACGVLEVDLLPATVGCSPGTARN